MTDINISNLPVITAATDDDMFIINDANAVSSIINWENLTASIANLSRVAFDQGSAALPSIYFDGDPNSGIYQPDSDKVAISTGGVSRLFVDSNGSVGIGNTNPSDYNSGANNLVIGSQSQEDTGLTLITTATGDNIINFADGTGLAGAVGQIVYDHGNNRMTVSTVGVEAYRITNTQDIIIGAQTGDADSRLTVAGGSVTIEDGSNTKPALNFRADLNTGLTRPADDNLALVTGGTQRLVIDESGNLGLGVADPLADIHINKPGATLIVTDSDAPGTPQAKVNAGDGNLEIRADDTDATDNSRISLFVDGTELTRIVATGEVIVPKEVVFNDAEDDVTDPFARIGRGITAQSRGLDGELVLEADPSGLYPSSAVRIKIDGNDSFLLTDVGDVTLLADGKIIFADDTDTYLEHPSADTLTVTTGGITAITAEGDGSVSFGPLGRIDRTFGRFTLGLPNPYSIGGMSHEFQVSGNALNYGMSLGMFGAGTDGQYLSFMKSAGDGTAFSVIADGDTYGNIAFYGDNGSTYDSKAAEISVVATGTVSGTSMPGTIVFSTTNSNEVSPTEHLRISPAGAIGLDGANYGNAGEVIISAGAGSSPAWGSLPIFNIATLPDLP